MNRSKKYSPQTFFRKIINLLGYLPGNLPGYLYSELNEEGEIFFLAEHVDEVISMKNFLIPFKYSAFTRIWGPGFIAVGERRILIRADFLWGRILNLTLKDAASAVQFSTKKDVLFLRFKAQHVIRFASGDVEIQLKLPMIDKAAEALTTKGVDVLTEK